VDHVPEIVLNDNSISATAPQDEGTEVFGQNSSVQVSLSLSTSAIISEGKAETNSEKMHTYTPYDSHTYESQGDVEMGLVLREVVNKNLTNLDGLEMLEDIENLEIGMQAYLMRLALTQY